MPTLTKPRLERMQYWTAADLRRYQAMLKLSRPEWKIVLQALQFERHRAGPVTAKAIQLQEKIEAYLQRNH